MKSLMSTALFAAMLAVTPMAASGDEPPKGDLAKLQGTWKAKLGTDLFQVRLVIKDRGVAVTGTTGEGETFHFKGDFALDETAKPHKTVDWKNFTSDDGEVVADILAIYEFSDDDTLKICSAGPGNGRPPEFKNPAGGSAHGVVVLTREKAAAENASAPQGDLAKFQGKWTVMFGPNGDVPMTLVFKGHKLTLTGKRPDGEEMSIEGEIRLDESAKPHKAIDVLHVRRPNGDELQPNLGIYEIIDTDTIKVCMGGQGHERPTEFKDGPDGHPHLVTIKRAKD